MTYSISIEQKQEFLGSWNYSYATQAETKTSKANLVLLEDTTVSVYPINKETGRAEKTKLLACKSFQDLLKTHYPYSLTVLLYPHRTHTFKEGLLDTCIPLSRRLVSDIDECGLQEIATIVIAFVIDLFTLIARIFTLIPAIFYNKSHPHPFKAANKCKDDIDSVYVECQKKWTLQVNDPTLKNEDSLEVNSNFYWRVDLYPPVSDTFNCEGNQKDIFDDDMPYVHEICLGGYMRENLTGVMIFNVQIETFCQNSSTLENWLPNKLKKPQVTYL